MKSYTKDLERLIRAVGGLRHNRLFEVIDYTFVNSEDIDVLFVAAEQLDKLSMTDELISYMVDMVVELEDEHPALAKKIMNMIR